MVGQNTGSSELTEDLTKSTYIHIHTPTTLTYALARAYTMHVCMYVLTFVRKYMRNIELYIGIYSLLFEIRGAISTKEYEYSPRLS